MKKGIVLFTAIAMAFMAGGIADYAFAADPIIVGSVGTPGDAMSVYISGAYAYVADYSSGLQVIDISNPQSPIIVGSVDTPDYAMGVYISGAYAYVAAYHSGLQVIDISNPQSPSIVGSADTPSRAYDVYVSGTYAYVADMESGLQVIDISNPQSPSIVGSLDTGTARSVYVSGTYAYVGDYYYKLQVIDISNPQDPSIVGSVDTPDSAYDVHVSGNYAYVANCWTGILVIDISNPQSPSIVGTGDTPDFARGVYVSGAYAYVADRYNGFQVIDISNPQSPTIVGSVGTPSWAYGVYVSGAYAYVADYGSGLQVIDISMSSGDVNEPPNKPILSSPSDGITGVSLTPTLQTGTFSDPEPGDTHLKTEWNISTEIYFSATVLQRTSEVHLTSLPLPQFILREGTTYYWRARFYDNHSNISGWSDSFSFSTQTTATDLNANGIPDTQENDTVDMDNDGTPDIEQDDIKSLNTVVGEGQMGVSRRDDPTVTSIESIESIDPETISELARPYSMPLGLFAIKLAVANAGDSAEVTVYFSEAASSNARWYVYDSIGDWVDYSEHATFSADRRSVTLRLKDGDYGDADGIANGIIVDPGGYGQAVFIEGLVYDAFAGEGIARAQILIEGLLVYTDLDGYYLKMIHPGIYQMTVSAEGYEPVTYSNVQVPESPSITLDVALDPLSQVTNLYFPHVDTTSPWETEIALINTSGDQSVSGKLRAFGNEGQLIDTMDISLVPHGRRQISVGDEFTTPASIGYLIFEADSNSVQGYTKLSIEGVYRVAVPAARDVNTSDIYVAHIDAGPEWWTMISLVNTTTTEKTVTLTFNTGESQERVIPAHGSDTFTIRDLFGGQKPDIQSAVITNAEGVVGLELFGNTQESGHHQLSGILLKDDTATTIYYPHIDSYALDPESFWWTGIVAYSPPGASSSITVTAYTEEGTALITTDPITIAPNGKYVGTVAQLSLPVGTAWLKIDATNPITGFELFGTTEGDRMAGYTGVGISGTEGVFAKIEKDGWTGIALVNIGDTAASVTLTAYDNYGNPVATQTLSLGSYAKVVDLAENIFTQDISSATYIGYASDREIVGFQLNGTWDNMLLDGLPGLVGVAAMPDGECPLEVTEWSPTGSIENTKPPITATFRSSCGADIDVSSIEMIFDGSPVSYAVSGSGSEVIVTYNPPTALEKERSYQATVTAKDVNGNVGEKTWGFYIAFSY